jgi:hypothetical protein
VDFSFRWVNDHLGLSWKGYCTQKSQSKTWFSIWNCFLGEFRHVQIIKSLVLYIHIYIYYFHYIRILGRDFLTDSTIISSWSSSEISLGKLQVYNEVSAESHGFLLRFFMGGQLAAREIRVFHTSCSKHHTSVLIKSLKPFPRILPLTNPGFPSYYIPNPFAPGAERLSLGVCAETSRRSGPERHQMSGRGTLSNLGGASQVVSG